MTAKRTECTFNLVHRPNIHVVEIELTTRCNLLCRHCDRRCTQAPADSDMPVEFVERFVWESRQLNHRWDRIALLGGEPTLHPHLETIVKLIRAYADENANCQVYVVSNACGKKTKDVIVSIEPLMSVSKRPKSRNEPWFTNMDIAPVDVVDNVGSCAITSHCGLGLSPLGYFPCGAGAAIARTLDWDIGVKSLRDVTEESMSNLLAKLCQYCGHALAIPAGQVDGVSPFWKEQTQLYRQRNGLA